MSAKLSSFEYTFVGAAPVSLDQVLGVRDWIGTLSLRTADSNLGDVFIGDSNMTAVLGRGVYLNPGDAWGFDLTQKFVYSTNIFLLGQAGDKVHIVWIQ
jgi:hypothetical protein